MEGCGQLSDQLMGQEGDLYDIHGLAWTAE